jgi:hypothetical protein
VDVTSIEVQVTSNEVKVTSNEVHVTSNEVHVTSNEVHVTSNEVHVTSNEVHVTSIEVHVTSNEVHGTSRAVRITKALAPLRSCRALFAAQNASSSAVANKNAGDFAGVRSGCLEESYCAVISLCSAVTAESRESFSFRASVRIVDHAPLVYSR